MWKKLGRLIINNFGLKVLAVVFAVIVWLLVVNTVDPDKAATFTVPVEVVNSSYLAEEGLTYEVLDNTDTISFSVTGKRSIVENLTADDFQAVANMQNIDETMTMVPISLTPTSYSSQLEITRRQSYMMVNVEPIVTREYDIELVVDGSPAGDYFVDSTEVTPTVVSVTGAESLVDEVASARTTVVVNGAEETFTSEEPVYLLNDSGVVLDEENIYVSDTEAEVTVNILMMKTVPVTFEITGETPEGYAAMEPQCDVETLTIAGPEEVLDGIEEVTISSPELDVGGATSDLDVSVYLPDLLPEGVTLYEDQPETVDVYVPVMSVVTREVEVPAKNISFEGLGDGLTAEISIDPIRVIITGPEDGIYDIRENNLTGTVDLTGKDVGNYLFNIEMETDGDYTAEATFSVSIKEEETGNSIFGALISDDTDQVDTEE